VAAETAIVVAMRCSTRAPLIAKPMDVADVSSVTETTIIKNERPNIIGVTRSFVRNPSQLIKANNTYTLNNGIKVIKEQATTCFKYARVVLDDDNCMKVKELKGTLL
jgi:hypothetical protein